MTTCIPTPGIVLPYTRHITKQRPCGIPDPHVRAHHCRGGYVLHHWTRLRLLSSEGSVLCCDFLIDNQIRHGDYDLWRSSGVVRGSKAIVKLLRPRGYCCIIKGPEAISVLLKAQRLLLCC